jgi:hypothetical protein
MTGPTPRLSAGLPADLADAMDDPSHDAALRASTADGFFELKRSRTRDPIFE